MSLSESTSEVVLELAEEFLERHRRGERPALREYVDRHPELANEIREVFPAMAMMENIAIRDESMAGQTTEAGLPLESSRLERLGDFRIIREIGHGGMGIVYEAEQISLGRHVALKVLPRQLVSDSKQRQRFEREAKAAAKLHHTNIVPVFGIGEHENAAYYVMQYIQGLGLDEVIDELRRLSGGKDLGKSIPPGGQLHVSRRDVTAKDVARSLVTGRFDPVKAEVSPLDRGFATTQAQTEPAPDPARTLARSLAAPPVSLSQSSGRLSDSFTISASSAVLPRSHSDDRAHRLRPSTYWHSVAQIGLQVAEALEHAHKQGVLHRDIKPSNLLLDMHGTVWVTDFGLAKADDQMNLTQSGDILGTVRYMAPEAFEGKTDARTDVYSLGLTLYEMLALCPAFGEKDRHRLLKQVMHEQPARLEAVSPDIPRDLATIVQKSIDREPDHRYASAEEMAADLHRFVNDEPIRARRILLRERLSRWCRRNPMVAGLTAALIALLVLLSVGSGLTAVHFSAVAYRETELALNERIALADARNANKEALKALDEAHAQSARLAVERGLGLIEQRDADRGLLWLTRALAIDPNDVSGLHRAIRLNLTLAAREQVTLPLAVLRPRAPDSAPPLQGQANHVTLVAYSPGGELAATGNRLGTIQLWNPISGQRVGKPFGPTGPNAWLTALAFTPDGHGILAATATRQPRESKSASRHFEPPGQMGDVQLWDAATGELRSPSVKVPGWAAAFSRDGQLVAAISSDPGLAFDSTSVRIFEVATGRQVGRPLEHDRPVRDAVAFSPDGRKLLTGDSPPDASGRSRARLWDVQTGRSLWASEPHPGWHIYGVAFSPDGKLVATAANDRHVRVFNAADGKIVGTPMENNDQVNVVAFSPDGRTIAAGMATVTAGKEGRNEIRLWDRKSGKPIGPDLPHDGGILALAFSPDGKTLLSSSTDGAAHLWALSDGPPVGLPIGSDGVYSVAITPDSRVLLTGGFSSTVHQYDPATGRSAGPALHAGKFIRSISVHPSGRIVAIGVGLPISTNQGLPDFGEVQLWDRQSGRRLCDPIKHHTDRPDRLAFTPDGQTLVTTDGKKVRLWDAATGATLGRDFEATQNQITSMALSPDGKLLLIGDVEGGFQHWDLASGQPKYDRVPAHRGAISAAAFSPDGTLCATGSWSKQARVWEVATGRPRGPMLKHNGFVLSVAFSPRESILATAGGDHIVRLWDAGTGTPLGAPVELSGEACRLAFTPDGHKLAVACLSHVLVLDAPEPAQGKAEELASWVEAITGRTLDEQEGVAPVGLEAWESRCRDVAEKGATPRSVARSPGWEVTHRLGSAIAAERAGDVFAAIWHLDKAIASQSDHPTAWMLKASLLNDAGRKDEARTALARAIELVQDQDQIAQLAWRLGTLEAELEHWSQASRAFETSIAWGRHDVQTYYLLDLSLVAAGEPAGLRRANSDMLAHFGAATDPALCNSVAWPCVLAADAVPDLEVPVRLANLAVKDAPEDEQPMYLNTLGATLYRAGQFEDAIRQLDEGIRRRNGVSEPQDWVFLALAHHRLGHREQALHWLQQLRRHLPTQGPDPFWSELEMRLLTNEAEAVILYDPIFPADPFAH